MGVFFQGYNVDHRLHLHPELKVRIGDWLLGVVQRILRPGKKKLIRITKCLLE